MAMSGSRQTAFPGIILQSIEARAGSSGRTIEFEEGLPEDIPPERVQSFLDNVNLFGSQYVDSELRYTMLVAAYTKLSASTKARAFVRAKNPFEASVIDVSTPMEKDQMGVLRGGRKIYQVQATVSK